MQRVPLVVVDGQLRAWDYLDKNLRPEDIDHIEILKGDAAVALYGTTCNAAIFVTTRAARKR